MISSGTSYSELPSSLQAAEAAAKSAYSQSGSLPVDVAIIFATADHRDQFSEISNTVKNITGAKCVIGASGYGIITENVEIERQRGLAVMTLRGDNLEMSSFLVQNLQESSHRAGEAIGKIINQSGLNPFALLAFPDTFSFYSDFFFDALEATSGYLPVVGGLAAEDGSEDKVYQIHNEEATFDSIAGVVLGGPYRLRTGIARTCKPFGEPVQITRADGNIIYEIDGRPAYDIFLEHLAQVEKEVPENAFQNIFLGLPSQNYQTDFNKAHYLTRNIMGVNAKNGMLTCAAPVEQGEFMTFTVREPYRARRDMEEMLASFRDELGGAKPYCGFYFNCCARGTSLYGRNNEDTELIRKYFPNVPIIGFFTYGEMAPLDHVNHLHHYSGVLSFVTDK